MEERGVGVRMERVTERVKGGQRNLMLEEWNMRQSKKKSRRKVKIVKERGIE